jgi:hypothetical protein
MEKTKVTIYFQSDFGLGVKAVEARLVDHGRRKYAQYPAAPYVDFVPKGKRKVRRIVQGHRPSLLIVAGWNQPKPDGIYDPATVKDEGAVLSMRGRYSACDPRWQSDFDAMIEASGVEIVADYRAK